MQIQFLNVRLVTFTKYLGSEIVLLYLVKIRTRLQWFRFMTFSVKNVKEFSLTIISCFGTSYSIGLWRCAIYFEFLEQASGEEGVKNYGKKTNEVNHSLGWALWALNRRWIVICTACIYLMWQHWVCFEFAHNQTHSRLSTLYHIESCVCRDENNVMVNKNKAEKKLVKAGSSSLCATKNDSTRPIPDPLLSWCFHCLCSLQI